MLELFKHNEEGYEALIDCLDKNQMATINHATGTGKSFIILKYIYNNRDKRILYLCPTYYIFDQLIYEHMKSLGISYDEFYKLDNVIYHNILKMDMKSIAENYDIIILDEYHRCGAKKWWKKIIELIELLKKSYPFVKVIGLTATNRRYLDNNRNMTDELFLGVCASTLGLDTAILNGLLPAPKYINSPYFCYSKIEHLKKIVDEKVFYAEDKEYFNRKITEYSKTIEEKTIKIFMDNVKENGKYIVFNNSIKSISENKARIKEWFKNYNVTFIEVHSYQNKAKNRENLKKFSESKKGLVFLFVVDVLNEGIHVKGVDGIIMLRHTISPIIYFQQIGRLLSFSSRKEQVIVLDMVDNLNSHNVITSLYRDVITKAKEKIKEFPELSQRYQEILDNFKIIDESFKLKEELQKLEKELSNENIIKRRIDTAISIFEENNDIVKKIQAHLDIYNFSEYIDIKRYRKIEKLGILDTIFEDDYLEQINGYEDLHEKNVQESCITFNLFCEFCKNNKKLPSPISFDSNERNLAVKVTTNNKLFTKKQKKEFKRIKYKYMPEDLFELIYYDFFVDIKEDEIKEFTTNLKEYVNQYDCINSNVMQFLRKNKDAFDFDTNNLILKKTSNKKEVLDFLNNNNRLPIYNSENIEETKIFLNVMNDNLLRNNKFNLTFYNMYLDLENVTERLNEFVTINHRYPNKNDGEFYEIYTRYHDMLGKLGFIKVYENFLKLQTKQEFISSLISFIKNHNGELPSSCGITEEEILLAKQLSSYQANYFYEEDKKLIETEISKSRVGNNFLQEYIMFLKKNKRYPNRNSSNINEVDLAVRYFRNEKYLTAKDKKIIKNSVKISRSQLFKNSYFANIE